MTNWWSNYWGLLPISGNMTPRKLSKFQNYQEFQNIFEQYFTAALHRYEWSGLPDTCDARMLEKCLLLMGQAMIAKVNGAYVVLGAAPGGGLNLYGYPIKAWGYGINGFNREFRVYIPGADDSIVLTQAADGQRGYHEPEAVICYDNIDAYPTVNYLVTQCQRMADILRACDVTINNLKSPYIIACDESELSTIKQALNDKQDNMATILTSKRFSTDMVKVWPTTVEPSALPNMWAQYRNIESMLLETLGINSNDNTDKRERLLVDEVNANNEEVKGNLDKYLAQRKLFCERVNNTFGLNIDVKIREEVFVDDDQADDPDGDDQDAPDDGALQRDAD